MYSAIWRPLHTPSQKSHVEIDHVERPAPIARVLPRPWDAPGRALSRPKSPKVRATGVAQAIQ